MKRFILIGVSIFLGIVLIVFSVNLCVKDVVIDTIDESLVQGKISDVVTGYFYEKDSEMDLQELSDVIDVIDNSEEIKEITYYYLEGIVQSYSEDTRENIDVSGVIEDLLENHREEFRKCGLDDEQIDYAKENIHRDSLNDVYRYVEDNVKMVLTDKQQKVMDLYIFITSDYVRGIIIGGIVVGMLAIFLLCLDWYCFMVYSGVIFLIAGIFVRFGIGMILRKVSYYVTNDVIGRSTGIVGDSFWNVGYVYWILGGVLLALYFIGKKLRRDSQDDVVVR